MISLRYRSWGIGLIVFLAAARLSSARATEQIWLRQLDMGECDSSIVHADVAEAPGLELLLNTTSGDVAAWDAAGRPLYAVHLGGVFSVAPTAADLFPGGSWEALVVDQAGRLTCLSRDRVLWHYALGGALEWNSTTIAVADLDGDGTLEILAGAPAGPLVCLVPEGVERWRSAVPGGVRSPLAVADLLGDGNKEILFSTGQRRLVCCGADGALLWEAELGCDNRSGPIAADLDGDGLCEIIIGGQDGRLRCFARDGRPRWEYAATAEIDSAIACGDIDGDGARETVAIDLRGHCVCLDAAGRPRWTYNVRNRCRRSPALADLDGDGEIEILVAGYDRRMYLLSHDGQEKDIADVPGTTNGGPTLVTAAGRLAAAVPFEGGWIGLYTWLAPDAATLPRALPVLWGSYRVTPTQCGALEPLAASRQAVRLLSVDHGGGLVGRNVFEVRVANPQGRRLALELRLDGLTGSGAAGARVESSADVVAAQLPYLIAGDVPQTVTSAFRVEDLERGEILITGRKPHYIEPFQRDLAAVLQPLERTGAALRQLRESHGRTHRGLVADLALLRAELEPIRERAAHPSLLDGAERVRLARELHDLAAAARARLAQAELLLARARAGASLLFAAWWANPWSPIRPPGQRPAAEPAVQPLLLYGGEHGSLAVDLLNLSDEPLDIRLHVTAAGAGASAPAEAPPAVALGQVIAVPTEMGNRAADAIAPLDPAGAVHLAPGEVRQLWLDVDAAGAVAGAHGFELVLAPLAVKKEEARLAFAVEVAPLEIAAAPAPRFCNWAYIYSSALKDHEAAARRDLIEHGTNVFVVTGRHMPEVHYDASGELVGMPDYGEHDAFLRDCGDDAMFLFCGYQSQLRGPADHGYMSPAYRKAHVAWIRQWARHLAGIGIGYDRFALYPIDEPGLNPGLVEQYIELAQLAREADRSVLMYADPVGRATFEEIERMAPWVDIWCPNREGYMVKPGDPRIDVMLRSGRAVWTYECLGNVKNRSPLGYYRGLAWLAEQYGFTGFGFWSYCTSAHDPWETPVGGHDYLLVYPGAGVVTSKRWEACRDGVEDWRAAWQLRARAAAARERDPADPRAAEAERVLDAAIAELAEPCRGDTTLSLASYEPGFGAAPDTVLDALDRQAQAFAAHRRRIAAATLALGGAQPR